MSFLDWVHASIAIDIAFIVLVPVFVWKIIKIKRKVDQLEEDVLLTMRNPAAAKRLLKERL